MKDIVIMTGREAMKYIRKTGNVLKWRHIAISFKKKERVFEFRYDFEGDKIDFTATEKELTPVWCKSLHDFERVTG